MCDFIWRLNCKSALFLVLLIFCINWENYCSATLSCLDAEPRDEQARSFVHIDPCLANEIAFENVEIKYLRFQIYSSEKGAPAIDELLVLRSNDSAHENFALRDIKRVDVSSCIGGYAIHRKENVIDGKFGNDFSWVAAAEPTYEHPQWIELEWNNPITVDRVVFSRDRSGRYSDRTPLEIEIQVSNDGDEWMSVSHVYGVTANLNAGEFTTHRSPWNSDVPVNPVDDWVRSTLSSDQTFSPYDISLQEAFLAEENALLKVAGYADCEPWLLQRRYPEYVEPVHKPECIVPLPVLKEKADIEKRFLSGDTTESDDLFSSETIRAFAPANFFAGPLLEQKVGAMVVGNNLYIKIEGARFLSENRAIISSENLPTRGILTVRGKDVLWKQIDNLDGRSANVEYPLQGYNNSATGVTKAIIPLNYLPDALSRGIYVSLGIGGRWVSPGGRPIHFRPADFSINVSESVSHDGNFVFRIQSFSERTLILTSANGEISVEPNQSISKPIVGTYGQAGPEVVWECLDVETKEQYRLIGFHYDPCYRPLCQLKDLLERFENDWDDNQERKDYLKRTLLPGIANPRYVDINDVAQQLGTFNERAELIDFFTKLKETSSNLSPTSVFNITNRALQLWDEYVRLCDETRLHSTELSDELRLRERELFLRVRLLKRDLFFLNDELESVEHILANKRNPFWPSHNYSDLFDSTWNPGGGVVLIDIPRINGRLTPEKLTMREVIQAGDGVIRNPSLSFDATKIYYSLRKSSNDYYRIFEYDIISGKNHQISDNEPFHDFWPTELPDGGLAFISTRCKKKFICWRPQAFVLYRMDKNGADIQPLSFANLSEFAPSVADDGRVLWTRSEYVDKGADYGHTLWTIRADGTSPELVFGNTINLPQGYANGRFVPKTQEVCCTLISHFGDLNGPIALIDQSKGPHDPSSIRSITPEVPWPGYWARSETFREPYPVTRDIFLVAHAALDRFGIYLIDRYGNRELLFIDTAIDTICPQPFHAREAPPIIYGSLDEKLRAEGLGRFSIANVYRGLEGQVEVGTAKYLRICQEESSPLEQLSDGTYQTDHEPFMEYYASPIDVLQGAYGWSSYVAKGVVGTVSIEEDGSADFVAPAGEVLFFELLDENFNEIQRMRSVVQLQPGERRSCIGCHESRLSAPEGGLTLASSKPSQVPEPPPQGAGPFWYEKVVQPVLDKNCVSCHTLQTAEENQKQVDLTDVRDENKIPASYRSLLQSGDVFYFDYTWGDGKTTKADPYSFGTFQSNLWTVLKDDAHKNVRLTAEEERAIKLWIDLNVPLWGDYKKRTMRED